MKLKIAQIYASTSALEKINVTDLDIAVSMILLNLVDELHPAIVSLEAKRKVIKDKYKPKLNNKRRSMVNKANKDAQAEFDTILEEEINIPVTKLSLSQLEGSKISEKELRTLLWLIENPSESDKT